MLERVSGALQLDRALAFALASRVWQAFSGPITIVFVILAYFVGWRSLSNTSSQVAWEWPFACLVPLAAVMFYLSPSLAILEGAGYREVVYRFRLRVVFVGSFVT